MLRAGAETQQLRGSLVNLLATQEDAAYAFVHSPYSLVETPLVAFAFEDRLLWDDLCSVCHGVAVSDEHLFRSLMRSGVAAAVAVTRTKRPRNGQRREKVRQVVRFLEALPPATVVLHLDASDTAVLGTPEEILAAFRSMAADIVLATEFNLFPDKGDAIRKHMEDRLGGRSGAPFINAGTVIGYAGALLGMYRRMAADDFSYLRHTTFDTEFSVGRIFDAPFSEQRGVYNYFFNHEKDPVQVAGAAAEAAARSGHLEPAHVRLDYDQKLFGTLYKAGETPRVSAEEAKVVCRDEGGGVECTNVLTGAHPLVWHGQGKGRYELAYLLARHGIMLPQHAKGLWYQCAAPGTAGMPPLPGDDVGPVAV
ncbi:unnamed protein product [Pedinophyceae sp. YPF-701]|nr:unnamed protein product [Pedinophyceae sp. YPF-701]